MTFLELDCISHAYGRREVVRALSLSLDRGVIGCLLGPSGCGKTTVLRAVAGFEQISQGSIRLGAVEVAGAGVHLPPERRRIGMVFQEHALFPHLSVAGNVGFALRGLPEVRRAARVRELLAQVGLEGREGEFPDQLSGGQQQRVALARALAPSPELLLLDEPFSSLDADLRERLAVEVGAIIRRAGITAVLVTHDQREAFAMADQIGVMHEGRIAQWGTPETLYRRPASRLVADFVGEGVFLPGEVRGEELVLELGRFPACARAGQGTPDGRVAVLLRPSDVIHDERSPTRAEVVQKSFRGHESLYRLRLESGRELLALLPSHHTYAPGERIGVRVASGALSWFAEEEPRPCGNRQARPDEAMLLLGHR